LPRRTSSEAARLIIWGCNPYSAYKITLKAEINADAWAILNSSMALPGFSTSQNPGRIAISII